jgi:hypothetical protein
VRAILFQRLLVFLDANTAKKHANFNTRHILAEPFVLLAYLKRQLSRVAHYQNRHLKIHNNPKSIDNPTGINLIEAYLSINGLYLL